MTRPNTCSCKKTEGINRQEEIFKRFIQLIHKHCTTQLRYLFYAAELFITPRLPFHNRTKRIRQHSQKALFDRHVIL